MRRNILITGASSGLGAEMARQFAAKGHNLALTARRTDRLEALRAELAASCPQAKVLIHSLDVTDHDRVFEVFRAVDAELPLDRVVVNAGLGKGAPLGTGRFDANRDTALTNFVVFVGPVVMVAILFISRSAPIGPLPLALSRVARPLQARTRQHIFI